MELLFLNLIVVILRIQFRKKNYTTRRETTEFMFILIRRRNSSYTHDIPTRFQNMK